MVLPSTLTSQLTLDSSQGGYRNSLQGNRMSGRSTPLAGYPEQYGMEGKMGWLAAFGTAGYPDGMIADELYYMILSNP